MKMGSTMHVLLHKFQLRPAWEEDTLGGGHPGRRTPWEEDTPEGGMLAVTKEVTPAFYA